MGRCAPYDRRACWLSWALRPGQTLLADCDRKARRGATVMGVAAATNAQPPAALDRQVADMGAAPGLDAPLTAIDGHAGRRSFPIGEPHVFARAPRVPRLHGLVTTLWVSSRGAASCGPRLERVLPTGAVHLVLRFGGPPLRVDGHSLGHEIVGGSRTEAYVREVSWSTGSVGAQLAPGAACAVLGLPAVELADRHTALADLWGQEAHEWRERIAAEASPAKRLDRFEQLLASRISTGPERMIGWAVGEIAKGTDIGRIVEASGFSHRHFLSIFRREVGLAPKRFARVVRFQRSIEVLSKAEGGASLAEVAHAAGYADQAHFTREFTAMAGLPPGRYRAAPRRHPNHVAWVNSVQDGE
ncbi:MAG TPA: AraC family transcriptional regulator [Vulgatibacter sp.]